MAVTITCLLLLAFSIWYVPDRIKKLSRLAYAWPWRAAAFLFTTGFPLLLMTGVYTRPSHFWAWLYNILGLLFIFQVCLFLYFLATHILTPVLNKLSDRGIVAVGIFLSAGYVGYGFFNAQGFEVSDYVLPMAGLEAPVKVMHISDLHLGAQRGEAYLRKVVETVNEYKPDLVLFNGDLVDSDIALRAELFALFEGLEAQTFFTTGNHEFYIDTAKALGLIRGAGIRILRSEMVETHGLQLIGLEYMNADRRTYDSHMVNDLTIEEELPQIARDPDKPTLLMHHSPVGLQYVAKGGIGVMLAGHTHGGQLFPGTVLAKMRFPLNKGLYKIDGTQFLVSQGAGTFGPWMRQGTFNEMQFITLVPAGQ